MNDSSKSCLPFDNTIRNTSLLTKMRKINNQLNRINIMRNNHQLSLLLLNQSNTMIQSLLHKHRFLSNFLILLTTLCNDLCFLDKSCSFLLTCFGTIFVEELEHLGSVVFIECVCKLSDCRRNLESFFKDLLLSLETDVLWPFYVASQVLFGLDCSTDSE